MNNNQQPKPDPKGKAIASFIFACISVVPQAIMVLLISRSGPHAGGIIVEGFQVLYSPIGMMSAILGLILGIMGLKSTKRNFAVISIILCIIGLLWSLYFLSQFRSSEPSLYIIL